jgi:hypothetical protein
VDDLAKAGLLEPVDKPHAVGFNANEKADRAAPQAPDELISEHISALGKLGSKESAPGR